MTVAAGGRSVGVSGLLAVVALIIFVLGVFGVHLGSVGDLKLTDLGLAFLAAAFIF